MKQTDLAWMAGLFDGEGSVGYVLINRARHVQITLQVGTTHCDSILRVSDLFDELGIDHQWIEQRMLSGTTIFSVRVQKRAAVIKACNALLKFSIIKAHELRLAKEACEKLIRVDSTSHYRPRSEERDKVHAEVWTGLCKSIPPRGKRKKRHPVVLTASQ